MDEWMIRVRADTRARAHFLIPRGIKSSDFMEAIAMSLASSLEPRRRS